jgi:Uma2 family endonuclease
MTQTILKICPADNGRRMSLANFEHAEVMEGRLYELGRGVIIVSDVPNPPHMAQVAALKKQLFAYDLAHPGRIYTIASGSECKILLTTLESERHPDLAVYRTAPPGDDSDVWYTWIPEIVIEVVSPDSEARDYGDKREEYLAFGVLEYWIVNAERGEMMVLRRRGGRWADFSVRPPQTYTTRRLPGLVIDVAAVFEAARAVRE